MKHTEPKRLHFTGAAGNDLIADVFGHDGPPVLLLHGGGQTRHAWRNTAERIAVSGSLAYAVDQRGHGDSAWVDDGGYSFFDYAADARRIADEIAIANERRPVAIGASLGGIAALLAEGLAQHDKAPPVFAALVLVDITPRVDMDGVAKVQGFMRLHAKEGFATIAEAAEAVAAYLPHRPRPKSNDGLRKNLRKHPDGRWRWHWDPRFMDGPRPVGGDREHVEQSLIAAARGLTMPALLVRGGSSELVQEAHAREFLELVPHAEWADVGGARHMVAGDRNDLFAHSILDFLGRLPE